MNVVADERFQLRIDMQGTKERQLRRVVHFIDVFLTKSLALPSIHRVLVFDIDDTLIWGVADTPIQPVVELLTKYSPKYPTYIVSARATKYTSVDPATKRRWTVSGLQEASKTLRSVGIARNHYRQLLLRPPDADPALFKQRMREYIQQLHPTAQIVTIGDQWWDVTSNSRQMSDLETALHGGSIIIDHGSSTLGGLLPAPG